MKDTSFLRSQRMKKIAQFIAIGLNKSEEVDLEGLNLWIEYEIGLTRKKASEYVKTVCGRKGWMIEDGKVKREPVD